ncbi:MAG: iron-containing alcohol dehydrogenase [Acidobacteriota bacterium]
MLSSPEILTAAPAPWSAQVGAIEVHGGAGCLAELVPAIGQLGGSRVLLVTDPGVRRSGAVERVTDQLAASTLVEIFDRVDENPSDLQVEDGTAVAEDFGPDLLLAVGGGSAMDCAKGINFLLTNGGPMDRWQGHHQPREPMLPSIGIPTTAGTGSEAQSFALISRSSDHQKMACGAPGARFRKVFLEPDLVTTVPAGVAAATGMDALSHAVESYVTTRGNPISRLLAAEAWRLLASSIDAYLTKRERGAEALLGSHLAGAAIEQSMLGAAHATANPLTARWGVTHGVAVGLTLPPVVRFNAPVAAERYGELLAIAGLGEPGAADAAEGLARWLESFRRRARLPESLSALGHSGIDSATLAALAADAQGQWTGTFNPRALEAQDFVELYRSIL